MALYISILEPRTYDPLTADVQYKFAVMMKLPFDEMGQDC